MKLKFLLQQVWESTLEGLKRDLVISDFLKGAEYYYTGEDIEVIRPYFVLQSSTGYGNDGLYLSLSVFGDFDKGDRRTENVGLVKLFSQPTRAAYKMAGTIVGEFQYQLSEYLDTNYTRLLKSGFRSEKIGRPSLSFSSIHDAANELYQGKTVENLATGTKVSCSGDKIIILSRKEQKTFPLEKGARVAFDTLSEGQSEAILGKTSFFLFSDIVRGCMK